MFAQSVKRTKTFHVKQFCPIPPRETGQYLSRALGGGGEDQRSEHWRFGLCAERPDSISDVPFVGPECTGPLTRHNSSPATLAIPATIAVPAVIAVATMA